MISTNVLRFLSEYVPISGYEEYPPPEPIDLEKRVRIKKKLCQNILTSHFFKMRKVDWVAIDHEKIREELKRCNRTMFYDIFHEYEYQYNYLSSDIKYGYDYVNLYRERTIRIGELQEVHEFAFTCPARESGIIKEYFVSRAYNVNAMTNPLYAYPIAGRFIFSRDENGNNDALKIVAMAEDSPLGSDLSNIFKFLINCHYAILRWRTQCGMFNCIHIINS